MNEPFNPKHLSESEFISDLACERRRANLNTAGVSYRRDERGAFLWERIDISSREGEIEIGRPRGSYDTLSTVRMDLLDDEDIEDAANEIATELCSMLDKTVSAPTRLLVVGLGNATLTPDSVGPKAAEAVNATMHLNENDPRLFKTLECLEIAVTIPGVMAKTGMESTDIVSAICDKIEPDAVIAIDAIASRSAERLGTTIQISNTGIFPGSGIGNRRRAITEKTLGIPVIAIGVPTVISARAFTSAECHSNETFVDLYVSPRDIDGIVTASSKIISMGINQAFGMF